jgi:hypothetical protein
MAPKIKRTKGSLLAEKRVEEAKLLLKLEKEEEAKVGEDEQMLDCTQDASLKAPEEEINLKAKDSSLKPQEDIISLKPRLEDASGKAQVDARLEAQVEDASLEPQQYIVIGNHRFSKDSMLRSHVDANLEAQIEDPKVEPPRTNIFTLNKETGKYVYKNPNRLPLSNAGRTKRKHYN